jgi:hypothetical protein
MYGASAYAARNSTSPLAALKIDRRDPTDRNERLLKSDVKYRSSIDMAFLKSGG